MNPTAKPTTDPSSTPKSSKKPTPKQKLKPATSPVDIIQDQCCPEDSGFCPSDSHAFCIPLLDMAAGGGDRPDVNGQINQFGDDIGDEPLVPGWVGKEYNKFLELPMFNGGKNGVDASPLEYFGRIGTAYIAYDCSSEIVCVAAHLDVDFLKTNAAVNLNMDDSKSWIRFGLNGATKLKESNSDEFSYGWHPNSSSSLIGYKGW
ncbi:hypothetical protein HJC23_009494 [Cyclotella cryptica]|uniref:Uncharacterized protein n=1 Tax=Cyclotella cryptica TaxID=29204 RepID=A0ABD3P6X6_9STRA